MNTAHRTAMDVELLNSESAEPHFGDLRKANYLKRRAAYQTQASNTAGALAAVVSVATLGKSRQG